MDSTEKFVLIDGNAIVHRAYHVMPPLTRADGTPTGAVQGFFSMILKIIQELKPEHVAIAFDSPVPNFRRELFTQYQSQRPIMESDLSPQFGIIQKILEKAKIPLYAVEGLEADDIIGTIAEKAKDTGHEVFILTGDRDMLQLVNHKTKVLAPVKGISEMILFDEEKVKEKYGIPPQSFIELKALVGDSSDNYPGVSGIGPKTASTLVLEYGSVDNIYKNLEKIRSKNPKLAEKLETGEKDARLAHQLATILTNAEFAYDFSDCSLKNMDLVAFRKAFEEYDFKTLPKRLDEVFKDGKIVSRSEILLRGKKIVKTQMKLI
jgi:DNA polymerase-1